MARYELERMCKGAVVTWSEVDCFWNVMAQTQKPDFVFRRNGRVHLNRQGRQCSRLLAAEVCASAVVMLDTPCSEVVWRVLATHSNRQFPLHFPSCASCAITFQLDCNIPKFALGEGAGEDHKSCQSGYPVSGPTVEPGIFLVHLARLVTRSGSSKVYLLKK